MSAGGQRHNGELAVAISNTIVKEHYLHDYNFDREHHGRITNGRRPADLVYGARKMEPR